MIQVNWIAVTSVVAIGALLTALLTYIVATVGRSTGHRLGAGAQQDSARNRDWERTSAAERRAAA